MTCEHKIPEGVWTSVVVIPPPYACMFCEMDRLREENERLRDRLAALQVRVDAAIASRPEKDAADLALLHAYQVAYFNYYVDDMRGRRDHERMNNKRRRGEITSEEFEAWNDARVTAYYARDPGDNLHLRMSEAQYALVAKDQWPEDYRRLVAEMLEEFGDD